MRKTLINILILIAVVAATAWGTKTYFPRVQDNTVTDTVYVDKPYKVTEIKEVEKPVQVTKYKTVRDTIETIKVVKDTVYIETADETFKYDSSFLTSYHTTPRFLGLQKQNMELNFTYQRTNGAVETKTWNIGAKDYEIGIDQGSPAINTYRPKDLNLDFSLSAGWLQAIEYGSPYLNLQADLSVYGINGTADLNINRKPFILVGMDLEF